MSSAFIQAINKNTLCTWYVLPFIGLNKYNFQEGNFIDSYMTRNGKYIVVEVADWNLCPGIPANKNFLRKDVGKKCDRLIFNIPDAWNKDIELFLNGAYSKMSEYAKQTIRDGSGLTYDVADSAGNKRTNAILFALERHPILREMWMSELTVDLPRYKSYPVIPEDLELLSVPSDRMFTVIRKTKKGRAS